MKVKVPLVLAAIGAVSCTRHVEVANRPVAPRPAMVETMERQVVNAVDAGDGDLGVRLLRKRLAAEPNNVEVRLELAQRYRRMGFPEIALEHHRLAAEQFPNNDEVHLALARELRQQQYHAEAARVLDRFISGHPGSSEVMYGWAGIVHDELGEWKAGELAHREAMNRVKGPKAYLHNNLGQNLLLQGKPEEAAEQFRLALKLEPGSEIARNNLGVALAGQPEAALDEWKSVADAASAHSNLAAVLIEGGHYSEARQQLELALGYKQDHPAALANLALVAELDGQPAVAETHRPASKWRRLAGAMGKFIGSREQKDEGAEAAPANGTATVATRE